MPRQTIVPIFHMVILSFSRVYFSTRRFKQILDKNSGVQNVRSQICWECRNSAISCFLYIINKLLWVNRYFSNSVGDNNDYWCLLPTQKITILFWGKRGNEMKIIEIFKSSFSCFDICWEKKIVFYMFFEAIFMGGVDDF